MSLDCRIFKRARTAAARCAAGAGSTAATALDFGDQNKLMGANSAEVNKTTTTATTVSTTH